HQRAGRAGIRRRNLMNQPEPLQFRMMRDRQRALWREFEYSMRCAGALMTTQPNPPEHLHIFLRNQDWTSVYVCLQKHAQLLRELGQDVPADLPDLMMKADQSFRAFETQGNARARVTLSNREKTIIGECLRAAADGPFLAGDVFQTLMGVERHTVRCLADQWPDVRDEDPDLSIAINNAMNNLLSYPHHCDEVWPDWISISRPDLNALFSRWRNLG